MQEKSLKSIRHNLPLLDIQLSGLNPELYKERYIHKVGTYYTTHKSGMPFFARIDKINIDKENTNLSLSWSGNETGVLDYNGLKDVYAAWAKWKYGINYNKSINHIADFIKAFNEGDHVPVTLVDSSNNMLKLAPVPELEGGVVILKDGMIKAMVGGYFDRHLNRASYAKRQLGSIFKPIIYAAALQLKWHSIDKLRNSRDLFIFENTYYLPSPDHEPKSDDVSMIWAGVKSENLATVWLLYHLTDKLNMSEFRQVVDVLNLNRGKNETYIDYVKRIRDKHGVIVNTNALKKAAFDNARKSIESDLLFESNLTALENINRLHFNIDHSRLDTADSNNLTLLRYDFKRLTELNSSMIEKLKDIKLAYTLYADNPSTLSNRMKDGLDHLFLIEDDTGRRFSFVDNTITLKNKNYKKVTVKDFLGFEEKVMLEDIWIDDLIPSGIIDSLHSHIKNHYSELTSYSRYDIKVLSHIRDFKTLVNLMYVRQLAHNMGISTWLDPVLSFPLGPNAISILEGALVYQTIMQGSLNTMSLKNEFNKSMAPVINRITDRDGEIIWEYSPEPKEVLSKEVASSITEILRLVVKHGTGRKAKEAIKMTIDFDSGKMEVPVPCFGKTGTANRFTNSSFIGFVPGIDRLSGGFDINEGYVIAAYVGFDNNFPMKGRNFSISGSSGALPIWIDSARGVVDSQEFKKGLHIADLLFLSQREGLIADSNMVPFNVSKKTGLYKDNKKTGENIDDNLTVVYSYINEDNQIQELERNFIPISGEHNVQH